MHVSDELKEYVRVGAEVLGVPMLRLPPLTRVPRWQHDSNTEEWTRAFLRLATARFGLLSPPRIAFRYTPLVGHAGRIREQARTWYVDIDQTYRRSLGAIAIILAHEMAHLVLHHRRVRLEPEQRNEELTDAVAALAGFGPLMVKWSEDVTEGVEGATRVTVTRRIGYLSTDDIRVLTRLHNHISTGRSWHARRRVDPDLTPTFVCPGCGTTLRLPRVVATIDLKCRRCGLSQRLSLGPKHQLWAAFIRVLRFLWSRLKRSKPA